MEGIHTRACFECYHWFRLGEEKVGECFAHPPRAFKVMQVSALNPRQQVEGLVSHYPVTNSKQRACGEFKPNLAVVVTDFPRKQEEDA